MHETFMQRALEIARESLDEPGALPYAAVIVKDGRIVGEGLNRANGRCDPTSHGEVEAIRDACAKLGTLDLSGCDLYTTAEPCSMCVATMYLSGIARLYGPPRRPRSEMAAPHLRRRSPPRSVPPHGPTPDARRAGPHGRGAVRVRRVREASGGIKRTSTADGLCSNPPGQSACRQLVSRLVFRRNV
jgi:tRNA(Arg) A34 adenosine deaminase TadA